MKKLLNSILASSLILSMGAVSFASELPETTSNTEVLHQIETKTLSSGKCGDNATYSFNSSTGTLTISGTGPIWDYLGDEFMGNYGTYFIADPAPWDSYQEKIKKVVVSEGITSFGIYAFWSLQNATEVIIPTSITYIQSTAFHAFNKLSSINIPNSVTSIGERAFAFCHALTEVVIPSSVTIIEDEAFYACGNLTTIYIPPSVTSIGHQALHDYIGASFYGNQPPLENLTVYGLANTTAETWSKENGIPFVAIDSHPDWEQNSSKTATPSTAKVMVNGKEVNFGAYNIDGFNFYKLTDMSFALNGTGKQFEVTWDGTAGAINMKIGSPHIVLGSELQGTSGTDKIAEEMDVKVLKNSALVSDLIVYSIDGSSYFQLDKLKGELGIDVGWDGATSTITITT